MRSHSHFLSDMLSLSFDDLADWRGPVFMGLVGFLLCLGCQKPSSEGSAPTDRSNPSESSQTSSQERASSDEGRPRVVTSDALPDRPDRIVSLAPNITEILFALGVGDRVVGVTKFCDYPEEATQRPSIGTFTNPDFEAILARRPDLVIGPISGGDQSTVRRLEKAGVAHAFLRIDTIEDVTWGVEQIGDWIGRPSRAEQHVATLESRMREVARRYRFDASPRVLMIYGHDPLVGAGPGTFGHQLLARLGATNVLSNLDTRYPRLDLEKVLELNPTYIVDTAMTPSSSSSDFWASHSSLAAVEQNHVAYITDPVVLRPGPRLPRALEVLGHALAATSKPSESPSPSNSPGSHP